MHTQEVGTANKVLHNKSLRQGPNFQKYCRKWRESISLRSPHLTLVALKVIILVHRDHPEDLFAALKHKAGQNGDFFGGLSVVNLF